ncbi:MAG: UDP-N-acetylglucosamine 1-carboxyvinyltransferase [Christensenellales bacterium]|jgi:UDP-N-acetylglucosamine 1-carboxyvinyltransferase
MYVFRIRGGNALSGCARIGCAKNAVLPILAASVLAGGDVTIQDCPPLVDIENMLAILKTLGCGVSRTGKDVVVHPDTAHSWDMPDKLSKLLRSSIFMLGPLIGRFRHACVTYPGGCEIGLRPIDLHLKGLRALGVEIRESHGRIFCDGANLKGGYVHLDFPSVGATENVMMAAVLAEGRTMIHNAAREPEIRDLQDFINAMGGKVRGGGTDCVIIDGVKELHGVAYTPIPDRIVAGTLLAACAATRGEITVENVRAGHIGAAIDKLRGCGCEIDIDRDRVHIRAPRRLKPFEISTQAYPGFPTDLQAQFTALACTLDGASMIVENMFESRFAHAAQLVRMGADIFVNNRLAVVRGTRLTGARVKACDLRGGAALAIAGLAAEGVTEINDCEMIDRGYDQFDQTLAALGGDVERIDITEA